MSDDTRPPRAPSGLGPAGRKVWAAHTKDFESPEGIIRRVYRPDELLRLEKGCRQDDENERLQAELASSPVLTEGSKGQTIVNSLFDAIRKGRLATQRLLMGLDPTDVEDVDAGLRKSMAGRRLARTRWNGG